MSVYVDSQKNKYGRMKMCHMLADSIPELHDMAHIIGMKRSWFQNSNIPHYDLSLAKRKLAVENGAIEIDRKQTVELIRWWRERL